MLLVFARRYWPHLLIAVLTAVWVAAFYQPRLTAARAERNEARALIDVQSGAIERLEADIRARREAAQKAIDEQRRKSDALAADNQRLRDDLASRTYRDEPCDNAAGALLEQWSSR